MFTFDKNVMLCFTRVVSFELQHTKDDVQTHHLLKEICINLVSYTGIIHLSSKKRKRRNAKGIGMKRNRLESYLER